MRDRIQQLTDVVAPRLRSFGHSDPSSATLYALLQSVYLASLRTEEGKFVRASLTYADPRRPDDLPRLVRAYYPRFSRLRGSQVVTPETLTKLG